MTDLPRLPKNCTSSLHEAGIFTLEECAAFTREDVGKLRRVGPSMLEILDACLRETGLSFETDSPACPNAINNVQSITDLPKIPKSSVAVLNLAGVKTLEDCTTWPANELAGLRGFGPKAFQTVVDAMTAAGLTFDESSDKRSDPINVSMAKERMKDAPVVPDDPQDLPNIGMPARSALAAIGIYDLAGISSLSKKQFLALHGVGPKSVRILLPELAAKGLDFKPESN